MIKKLTNGSITLVQKYLPDPFIFALALSGIVFILGIFLNGQTPMEMIIHWGQGFWKFLGFSMQMTLVVILGNCLATAPFFDKLVTKLSKIPKTPKQGIAFVTFVAGIACLIQWGFGLVIGAILAKRVAKNIKGIDFRLLMAAAYSAFLITAFTSSIPLKAASNVEDLIKVTGGVLTELIPLTRTAYHPITVITLLFMLFTLPLFNSWMHPSEEETVSLDSNVILEEISTVTKKNRKEMTPAERLENSVIVSTLVFIAGLAYIYHHFFVMKNSLNIDMMNFLLFMFGIFLHKTPIAYINAIKKAIINAAGIILQFPFYAGIMGMMTGTNADGVTLAGVISQAFVTVSNKATFPFFSFLSAALVNMFVPSAGGQWGVQAPVLFPAGQSLGIDPALTTMALCWGDTWTNMIQPFWALPVLGIAGLGVRDIMGFCVMVLLYSFVIISVSIIAWTMILPM